MSTLKDRINEYLGTTSPQDGSEFDPEASDPEDIEYRKERERIDRQNEQHSLDVIKKRLRK